MTSGGSEARAQTEWSPPEQTTRILTALSAALAAGLIILVGVRWYAYQWDFHMFYGAARDFAAGKSPYRGEGLSFYHPPITLYIYRLFTYMPEPQACTVWYLLKLLALGGLIAIWNTQFVTLRWQSTTIVFFILAYDGAIYGDLVAGNVSIFEELLLWFGFSCLLRARYLMFSICVIAAAQVKLTPIFFAVLLLGICDRVLWGWFAATLAGFAAVFSLNQWLQPTLFRNFWIVSAQLDERGTECTSILALVRDICDRFLGPTFTAASRLDELVFLAIVAVISIVSLWRFLNYRRGRPAFDRRLLICFSCFVFALISPRIKVYTYILLLAPTLYLFHAVNWRPNISKAFALTAVLVLFPQAHSLFPFRYAFDLFNSYLPLVATAALWLAYLFVLNQGEDGSQSMNTSPTFNPS